jgi:DNA-binding NtrC family response regulator
MEAKTGTGGESSSLLEDQERLLIADTLRAVGGNQSEAARRLGIGRDALRYKIKRYEMPF